MCGGVEQYRIQLFGWIKMFTSASRRCCFHHRHTVINGVLQYTFGGVLQDTIMSVGVVT